jgi:hypothetical protein
VEEEEEEEGKRRSEEGKRRSEKGKRLFPIYTIGYRRCTSMPVRRRYFKKKFTKILNLRKTFSFSNFRNFKKR